MIMLNEECFANFINIGVQGHCLTFIQGHLKPNFETFIFTEETTGPIKVVSYVGPY